MELRERERLLVAFPDLHRPAEAQIQSRDPGLVQRTHWGLGRAGGCRLSGLNTGAFGEGGGGGRRSVAVTRGCLVLSTPGVDRDTEAQQRGDRSESRSQVQTPVWLPLWPVPRHMPVLAQLLCPPSRHLPKPTRAW